ncbi:MAG: DUF4020 domain-containing protein [Gemmatimonadetes bacterium]|nr:DUF4020 domain-containing protein [Gemmatimonadota bacterium]MYB70317.1 DUF4020 domain-containing protein [Gemmatimonadota bacterium]
MKIAEIDFPSPLLSALRDGELVIFAGAGVSKGKPACLPLFKELAEKIAQGTGEVLREKESEREPEDRFLGRLHQKGVKVHERAVQELSRNNPKPTDLHRDLLRLYQKNGEQVRVVTTNFDLLFEEAAQAVFGAVPEIFRAPALPLGRDFNGIVHVHGALSHRQGMVLTDEDFGRAYLTEGWARRFLVELFRRFPVLFVGYRHNDMILNYLARALPPDETKPRFALTDDNDLQRWNALKIESIGYPKDQHEVLYEGVCRLAEYVNRGVLDWQREITDLAEKPPPSLDEEAADLIADSLSDAVRTRFFTQAATSPEWIDWLSKRGHLDPLFGTDDLSEPSAVLAGWLAENFAHDQAYKLFLLIAQHQMQLNPSFWYHLQWAIGKGEKPLDEDTLSRWVSLLLETAPADMNWPMWLEISKRCNDQNLMPALLQIFAAMLKSRLLLKGFKWPSDDENDQMLRIDVDLPLACDLYELNELWEKGLKPNLSQVAEPLLSLVVQYFEDRHRTLSMWQQPDIGDYISCPAIEPHAHAQNISVEDIDILTDAARDSLEWLASNQANVAAAWCDLLISSDIPRLRRLAVHTLSVRSDLTADAKIDWLLTRIGLYDLNAHHETFRAVKQTYPQASPAQREKLIEVVLAYRWLGEDLSNREENTAYRHFNWLSWLHDVDPTWTLAKTKLDEVWKKYPKFKKPEHPDFIFLPKSVETKSPWSVKELLAKPAGEWLEKLLSFHSNDPFDEHLLQSAVGDAAKQEFRWGLDLADALVSRENWETNFWTALIQAWSGTVLDENQIRTVIHHLKNANLYQKHGREIAYILYNLVRDGGRPYALELLPQANKIAAALWASIDREPPFYEMSNWLSSSSATLALFWLESLSLWRKQQDPVPNRLDGEYLAALSKIVEDRTIGRRFGKTILVGEFVFLLAIDENWTKENLLPLFFKKNHRNADDYKAIWNGFLTLGRLTPPVAELLGEAFLEAVQYINSDLSDRRDKFIEAYVTMIGYYVNNPSDEWIPKFFAHSDAKSRHIFASKIDNHLYRMDEARQQNYWQRWLKRYWQNRLEGVPKPLEPDEIKGMLKWLAHLTGVFSEAIDLAIKMPKIQGDAGGMLYGLEKGDLPDAHPEAMARLVIYLDLPSYDCELIHRILQSPLPPELKTKLQELDAKLIN